MTINSRAKEITSKNTYRLRRKQCLICDYRYTTVEINVEDLVKIDKEIAETKRIMGIFAIIKSVIDRNA